MMKKMIRHKEATEWNGKLIDVYECEECEGRQLDLPTLSHEFCNHCGYSNAQAIKEWHKEEALNGII